MKYVQSNEFACRPILILNIKTVWVKLNLNLHINYDSINLFVVQNTNSSNRLMIEVNMSKERSQNREHNLSQTS